LPLALSVTLHSRW